jgi:hypothetical protein
MEEQSLGFGYALRDGCYRVTTIERWAARLLVADALPAVSNARDTVQEGDIVTSIDGARCCGRVPAELDAVTQQARAEERPLRVGFDFSDGAERLVTVAWRRAPIVDVEREPVRAPRDANSARARVVVIGAGVAGMAGARELARMGLHVTILEARNRTGGRVHTEVLKGDSTAPPAYIDSGASFIHGCSEEVNPVYSLAVKHKANIDQTNGGYSIAWAQTAAWYDKGSMIPRSIVSKSFNVMWQIMYNLRQQVKERFANTVVPTPSRFYPCSLPVTPHPYHTARDVPLLNGLCCRLSL